MLLLCFRKGERIPYLDETEGKLKKQLFLILVSLTALVTIAGCSSVPSSQDSKSPGAVAAAGASGQVKVGYISLNEKVAFVHLVTQGIEAEAKRENVDLVVCDAQGDAGTALSCAKTLKQQHVQGLINYQRDAKAAPQICAQGPQVPVIAISIKQPPCEVAFTGADNLKSGMMAGDAVGKYMKEKFNCQYDAYVSLENPDDGALNTDRMGGYRQGFEAICGKIHGLRTISLGADEAEGARAGVTDTLTALPAARAIVMVGLNDTVTVAGLAAASAAGRASSFYVSGQGLDPSGVCGMRKYSDQWIADTAFFPEHYGSVVIPAILKAVKGESIPTVIPAKIGVVTPSEASHLYPDVKCK